jgi:hypothetical protein
MSDTPRTDALEKVDRDEWDKYYKEHTDDSFDNFLVYDIARGFERELAEMCTQRDAAVAARIELAKDNLALIKELESIGITTLNGVPNMTLRDYFAGQAMIGIAPKDPIGASTWIGYAAYEIADAMIKARNQEAAK